MRAFVWLILTLTLPLGALAQRGPRPWWDGQISRDLNLSDVQSKQIRSTVEEYRGRMMDLRATVNRAEHDVQASFDEDPVDQTKANDAINRLASARGELTRAVSQMDLRLRTILTAEQWNQLQSRTRRPGLVRPPGRRRGPVSDPGDISSKTTSKRN
jgi:Spy/CpxP family protein refolding chaperone